MKSIAIPHALEVEKVAQPKRLLLVGPKPPPIGGSPLTMQAMLAELAHYPCLRVTVINTSPATDVRKKMTGFNLEKVARSFWILPQYLAEIRHCDAVVVFSNDFFSITLVPFLVLLAKLFRKPFFLKPVAASLDLFINAQKPPLRAYLLAVLRATDGILAQTQRLRQDLAKLGCRNVHYLPGCRPLGPVSNAAKQSPGSFRLIFLAHITRLKGPLVLLEALQLLQQSGEQQVGCDFYGPIHDEIRDEFMSGLERVPNTHYCGVADAGTGPQLISNYDALVLPTYFDTEGHPGVLIEAMHAGVPVITTQIRTLPELVTDGVNGFLVPTQNSQALAEAIRTFAVDPELRRKMGEANRRKGQEFRADTVVAQMLKIVFPETLLQKELREL